MNAICSTGRFAADDGEYERKVGERDSGTSGSETTATTPPDDGTYANWFNYL